MRVLIVAQGRTGASGHADVLRLAAKTRDRIYSMSPALPVECQGLPHAREVARRCT